MAAGTHEFFPRIHEEKFQPNSFLIDPHNFVENLAQELVRLDYITFNSRPNSHINRMLQEATGFMHTEAGNGNYVAAQDNPFVLRDYAQVLMDHLRMDQLAYYIDKDISADHLCNFLSELATADTDKLEFEHIGVDGLFDTAMTDWQKQRALYVLSELMNRIQNQVDERLKKANYRPDLARNILNKIKSKLFLALEYEKTASQRREAAKAFIIDSMDSANHIPVISQLPSAEIMLLSDEIPNLIGLRRYALWEQQLLEDLYHMQASAIRLPAHNLAFDYAIALKEGKSLSRDDYMMFIDVNGESVPRIERIRHEANRYMLQYAYVNQIRELLELAQADYWELVTGRSLYNPLEDNLLIEFVKAAQRGNKRLFVSFAKSYLAQREQVEVRSKYGKEFYKYNLFVKENKGMQAIAYAAETEFPKNASENVEVEAVYVEDKHRAGKFKLLPFGREQVQSLLGGLQW